jgi:large subunit ribosomal protein L4
MAEVKLYNQQGDNIGDIVLNPKIFEIESNNELVKQVVVAQLANKREAIADTKTRGEVRGGGKKPWKQKGTGRARQGSIRSPIWKGGGVVFGPTSERNFSQKVNKKMKKKALFVALSEKVRESVVSVIEGIVLPEAKTKNVVALIKKLGLAKKTLLVVNLTDENVFRAARNIEGLIVTAANSLNIIDVLKNKNLLFTKDALKVVEDVYLDKK